MRKPFTLCLLALLISSLAHAQIDYTWTGTVGDGNLNTAANWSPSRTTPAATDGLIFNSSATITTLPAQTIRSLSVTSGTLTASNGSAVTLTINGDLLTPVDFSVASGATISIGGSSAITISLASAATGEISGTLIVGGAAHKLLSVAAAGLAVKSGGAITTATNFSGNLFGTTPVATNNNVVFEGGSTYNHGGGSNPFGAAAGSGTTVVEFAPTSTFNINSSSGVSMLNRVYGNIVVNATLTTSDNFRRANNFSVTSGFTYTNTNTAPQLNLLGNFTLPTGATLANPNGGITFLMMGNGAQNITSASTIGTVNRLLVGANSNLTLGTNLTLAPSAPTVHFINGILDLADRVITGNNSGTLSVRSASNLSTITGDLATATPYTITNVSSTSGLNLGMSVAGTGIAANTVIIGTTSNTITLSQPVTASGSAVTITPSYGAGTVQCSGSGGLLVALPGFNSVNFLIGSTMRFMAATSTPIPANLGSNEVGNLVFDASATLNLSTIVATSLKVNAGTLTTAGLLTLRSNSSLTARWVNAPGAISGNVAVQRFIPGKTNRKSILLAAPISQGSGQFIANAWQQQIHITGAGTGGAECADNLSTSQPGVNLNGFDVTNTNNPSMFVYNALAAGSKWESVASTNATALGVGTGYRLVVRGPRTEGCSLLRGVNNTDPGNQAQTFVTLSATGSLNTGALSPTLNAGFNLVGNPYAAPIGFRSMLGNSGVAAGIQNKYWAFDPNTGGSNNTVFSVYDTSVAGDPAVKSNFPNTVDPAVIASGQGFFVRANNAGTQNLFAPANTENLNAAGLFRSSNGGPTKALVRTRLLNDTALQLDEAVVRYVALANATNQGLSPYDAANMSSGPELISSQKAGTPALTIQTRQWPSQQGLWADTVQLNVSGVNGKTYRLNFSEWGQTTSDILLRDKLSNTTQDVKLNPVYTFTASNTLPIGDRFELIFRTNVTLAAKFLRVSAYRKENRVVVNFTAQEDGNVIRHEVERSTDGTHFETIAQLKASQQTGQFNYQWEDEKAPAGVVYYHIKAVNANAGADLSQVATVDDRMIVKLQVYPNPVVNTLQVNLADTELQGRVTATIYDARGQQVMSQTFAPNTLLQMPVQMLAKGQYQLLLLDAQGKQASAGFLK